MKTNKKEIERKYSAGDFVSAQSLFELYDEERRLNIFIKRNYENYKIQKKIITKPRMSEKV